MAPNLSGSAIGISKKQIQTVVNLPAFVDELFPQDIAAMLKGRLTFKEAIESPAFSLMSRHRLKVAQRNFYSRLDTLSRYDAKCREISSADPARARADSRTERSALGAVGIAKGAP